MYQLFPVSFRSSYLRLFIVVSLFTAALTDSCTAQGHPPFWDEIQAFKKQDSISFPPQHAILFVGSSSFRMWSDVQDYFPGYTIINRGFGGSTMEDMIRYADDIILPYHPKQIIIYSGENDIAYVDSVKPQTVLERVKTVFNIIRKKYPEVNIQYISIKPSPSRMQFDAKNVAANQLIRDFITKQKNAGFIDVYHLMLGSDGKPLPHIFKEDNLHMNPKGYAIWQKAIQPVLLTSSK